MKSFLGALIIITVGMGLYAMYIPTNNAPLSIDTISIAEGGQPIFGLLYIADKNGYFRDVGLEVTFNRFSSGKAALEDVIEGQSDLATVFETPVVIQALAGEQLSIITELHQSRDNTGVVARKDNGIHSIADLKDKKIGVTIGSNAQFVIQSLLVRNETRTDEVTFIDTKPDDMAESLSEGTVDAVSTWNPHLQNSVHAIGEDNAAIFFSDDYTEMSVLAGMRDYVDNHPIVMQKLLIGLLQAEEFLRQNKVQSIQIINEYLQWEDLHAVENTWSNFVLQLGISNTLLTILEQEALWLSEGDSLDIPNFRILLKDEYIKELKPTAVTVF